MATHSKRIINHLTLDDGSCITQYSEKGEARWASFKNRMGVSEYQQMFYDI
jgi:hypothetical protein